MRNLNLAMRNVNLAMGNVNLAMGKMNLAMENLNLAMGNVNLAMRKMNLAMRNVNLAMGDMNTEMRNVESEMPDMSSEMRNVEKEMLFLGWRSKIYGGRYLEVSKVNRTQTKRMTRINHGLNDWLIGGTSTALSVKLQGGHGFTMTGYAAVICHGATVKPGNSRIE